MISREIYHTEIFASSFSNKFKIVVVLTRNQKVKKIIILNQTTLQINFLINWLSKNNTQV